MDAARDSALAAILHCASADESHECRESAAEELLLVSPSSACLHAIGAATRPPTAAILLCVDHFAHLFGPSLGSGMVVHHCYSIHLRIWDLS